MLEKLVFLRFILFEITCGFRNICFKLSGDLEIRFEDEVTPFLVNVFGGHRPSVVHANGPTKNHINTYGNYVPGAWNANDQCTACWEENLDWEEDFKVLCRSRHSEHWQCAYEGCLEHLEIQRSLQKLRPLCLLKLFKELQNEYPLGRPERGLKLRF